MADTLRHGFGHDEEIGALFEAYDRLVRWEEHNSRLDAQEPIVERAVARGKIVAFIANTAFRAALAAPEPQDVEGYEYRVCATGDPGGHLSRYLPLDRARAYLERLDPHGDGGFYLERRAVGPWRRLAQPEGGSYAE
jgi:hypothetical protein